MFRQTRRSASARQETYTRPPDMSSQKQSPASRRNGNSATGQWSDRHRSIRILKLAFSTLGCPEWTLEQVVEAARNLGYQGIELRALGGSINLLPRSEIQLGSIERTGAFFRDQNLAICCLVTSCCFDSADARTRQENIEIALRHCEIAAALDAPLIRVFPNEIPAGATCE